MWDLNTGRFHGTIQLNRQFTFSTGGAFALTVTEDRKVRLVNLAAGLCTTSAAPPPGEKAGSGSPTTATRALSWTARTCANESSVGAVGVAGAGCAERPAGRRAPPADWLTKRRRNRLLPSPRLQVTDTTTATTAKVELASTGDIIDEKVYESGARISHTHHRSSEPSSIQPATPMKNRPPTTSKARPGPMFTP